MPSQSSKHTFGWVLSVIFLVLIFLPFWGSFFGWDFYEQQNENRKMAEFPKIHTTPIAQLPPMLDAYCNDHFGFRNTFIRRYRGIEEKYFGRQSSKALKGAEPGWYFYSAGGAVADYLGNRNFSDAELHQWEQAIKTRTDLLAERNVPYIFLLLPDKTMVYPEYLPENIRSNRGTTRYEQLQRYLKQSVGFSFAYPLPELLAGKENGELYFPGDTHWNEKGGYIGYCYLVDQLKAFFPSFKPIPEEQCSVKTSVRKADIAGTLVGKNVNVILKHLIPPQHDLIREEQDASLVGTNWTSNVRCPPAHHYNPEGKGTALVIHDSFYDAGIHTLLPSHFEHTYFFFMYASTPEFVDMVNRLNPDVVIEMRVERSLRRIPENQP